jgi:ribosomal protein L6P/L9E
LILIKGVEKQHVFQVASEIKQLYTFDVYKGKGIYEENKVITLKKGKSEGK